MAGHTLAIEDFRHGLDVRKSALTAPAGSLQILDDCVLNQGGEIEKRRAFIKVGQARLTVPGQDGCLLGIFGNRGALYYFAIGGDPFPDFTTAPGVSLPERHVIHRIGIDSQNSGITPTRVNSTAVFGGYMAIAASIDDPGYGQSLTVGDSGTRMYGAPNVAINYNVTNDPDGYALARVLQTDTTGNSNFVGPLVTGPNAKERNAGHLLVSQNKAYWTDGNLLRFSSVGELRQDNNTPAGAGVPGAGYVGGGYIDLAVNDSQVEYLAGIEQYYNRVAVFTRRTTQIWSMDPDPSKNALQQILRIGSMAGGSIKQFGTGDVLFLSDSGIRSLRSLNYTLAAGVIDVGSPVDKLIQGELTNRLAAQRAVSLIEPSTGRYWLAIGANIYVLSFWASAKISAWSRFTLPFNVVSMTTVGTSVYVQDDQGNIYIYGGTDGETYDATVAHIRTPHLSADKPTVLKKATAVAAIVQGSWTMSLGATADNTTFFEPIANINGPTVVHQLVPAVARSTHFAMDLQSSGSGPAILSSLAIDYNANERL